MRGAGGPGFVDALDALTDYPIRERLGEIFCPTLIVWGADDRLIPVRDAAEFARLIPGARKVVWSETGHVPMLERPDAFNALVDEFVAEKPRARAGAGGSGRGGGRAPRQRSVTAPSDALDTSAAYFARTPVASPFSGAS